MDKNQTIGLLLISIILLGYFYFFAEPARLEQQQIADSTSVVSESLVQPQQSELIEESEQEPTISDSVQAIINQQNLGAFYLGASGQEKDVTVENDELRIVFSSRGGVVKEVELKKHLTFDKKPLILIDENSSNIELLLNNQGKQVDINKLYYQADQIVTTGDTLNISFSLELDGGKRIIKKYQLPPTGFQLLHSLRFDQMGDIVGNQNLVFSWHDKLKRLEEHFDGYHGAYKKATVNYYTASDEFNGLSPTSDETESEEVNQVLKWVTLKQKFFNASIISESGFSSGKFTMQINPQDTTVVKTIDAVLTIPGEQVTDKEGKFTYYFGTNNYQITKKVTTGFSQNVDMGWAVFSWINKIVIIPVFNFLENYISNYGIIIMILVLLIKLVLSPLSYKSYVSMAKTKVLKPEMDLLKEKYGNDMQKIQSEQMKLYQQVGVNPLSGCIPVVLQMPILLAMFNFFPNSVELRQESFLWANDLSTFDSVLTWGYEIPWYGNHLSLFTLLMTGATLLYTWSNNQMSAVQGPMKNIGYIMPVMFMFVLNSYPAGLTFYYFVSTLVTFLQQTFIKRFVNEDKIRALLDENRKKNKNKKKSKFQAKLEEAMKAGEEQKKKKNK